MLDAHSPVPLYYQLRKVLEDKINSGEIEPGEQIPSENQLCKAYGISRTTVRQAINEMVNDGQLVRTQGRGTFVEDSQIIKTTPMLSGFTQDMINLGYEPRTKILELLPLIPPFHVQKALQLENNEVAIIAKRLRLNGDKVLGIDASYFPFNRFQGLLNDDLEDNSVYRILKTKYKTIPSRSIYNFEACKCPREVANLLEVAPGFPVLFLKEIVFDQNNNRFEYGEEYYRADRYSIRVDINRQENDSLQGIPEES